MKPRFLVLLLLLGFGLIGIAQAGIDRSLRLDLAAESQGPSHYPWARYRVAVFSFEDPEQTGLGDAVARIISRRLLFESPVSSIAVVNYQEGLAPEQPGDLGYYDKVEKLTEREDFILAIWGRVQPLGDRLRLDAFIQLSPEAVARSFSRQLRLPRAMGGGVLRARLRPDRFRVQQLVLPRRAALAQIRDSAERLLQLRPAPNAAAAPSGSVPRDQKYFLSDRRGSWVKMQLAGGGSGWISADALCRGHCRPLLEVADFAGGLLSFARDGKPGNATDHLHTNALAVEEQLKALAALDGGEKRIEDEGLPRLMRWIGPERWIGRDKWTRIDRVSGAPPGGGAFANLLALSRTKLSLEREKLNPGRRVAPQRVHRAVCRAARQAADSARDADMACDMAKAMLRQPDELYWFQEREVPDLMRRIVGRWDLGEQSRDEVQSKLAAAVSAELSGMLFEAVKPPKDELRSIAAALSRAVLDNPTERELLDNLALLFDYLGEGRRAGLARELAGKLPEPVVAPNETGERRREYMAR